jgi:hypothetical protein
VRVPSVSGDIVNWKRRQRDDAQPAWTALTAGAGVVNAGQHAYAELLVHVSASEDRPRAITPYGALRVSQVVPVVRNAVSDQPTACVVFDAQIGDAWFAFSPEIGVFNDKSALGLNSKSVIVVPSISLTRRAGTPRMR